MRRALDSRSLVDDAHFGILVAATRLSRQGLEWRV